MVFDLDDYKEDINNFIFLVKMQLYHTFDIQNEIR